MPAQSARRNQLRKEIVVPIGEPDAGNSREQAHRNDHDDRQRKKHAFILRGEYQEHEQNPDWEHDEAVLPARICW